MLRECVPSCTLLHASGLDESLASDSISLLVIESSAFLKEALASILENPRYSDLQKLLVCETTEEENLDFDYQALKAAVYRKPLLKNSLKAHIGLQLELLHHKRKAAESEAESAIFKAIFNQSPVGIFVSQDGVTVTSGSIAEVSINAAVENLMGRSKAELGRVGWAAITHPDDLQADMNNFNKLIAGEIDQYEMDKRYIRPDGSSVWAQIAVAQIHVQEEKKPFQLCLLFDISRRKKLELALFESERTKSILLSHLPGLAYRCDNDSNWTMRYVSDGCYSLTGYKPEELQNNKRIAYNEIISVKYRGQVRDKWELALSGKQRFQDEYEIITADGTSKWVLELAQGVFDKDGDLEDLEGIVLDITDRKKYEDQLLHYNEHDQWTGLFNRRAFEELLQNDAQASCPVRRAMIEINLSSIQMLSITYGFDYAQEVTSRTVELFETFQNADRLLFHTYANRYVFYFRTYSNKEELVRFSEKLSEELGAILSIERIGWGIGIIELGAFTSLDIGKILRNLLITSEQSLTGFGEDLEISFFDELMESKIERKQAITEELAEICKGIGGERLSLDFQPILDLDTNAISGFEALARLQSRTYGSVPPLEFIPIAEESKLIIPLGWEIFKKAFQFQQNLRTAGFDRISVAVNISAVQLLKSDFIPNLVELTERFDVDTRWINLELTESIFSSDFQEMNKKLGNLQQLGFHISLDDFGTGYSSFARERELNINCLKIDKFFVDKLEYLEEEKSITGDIISMGHKLGHYIIAEGVEHSKQHDYLRRHGCDKVQGYLVSRPIGEKAALALLVQK